jgi:hypothetical protein
VKVLAVDVGGSSIKVGTNGRNKPIRIPSGPELTAAHMLVHVRMGVATNSE